jgi:hypothetical protein
MDETYGTHGTSELDISPIGPISPIRANVIGQDTTLFLAGPKFVSTKSRTNLRARSFLCNALVERHEESTMKGRHEICLRNLFKERS